MMSDDVLRFADREDIDKFTVMGHSMGARTAMTLACRFPDRVDGCISLDAAPKNEEEGSEFGAFAENVIDFMLSMKHK